MRGLKTFLLLFVLIILSLILPAPSFAQAIDPGPGTGTGTCDQFRISHTANNVAGQATISDMVCIFSNVTQILIALGGLFAFFMLITGAFKYITSSGDPKAAASAKGTLTWAVGGLFAVLLSFFILKFVFDYTGFNVFNFTIPGP